MYTGDPYMDTLYLYFPHMLTTGDLFKAVESRFPKLPNLYKMNRQQLLDFYNEHIAPRPQRRSINTRGILARALHSMDVEDPKKDLENRTCLYPGDESQFPRTRFGLRFWHDSLQAELDEKIHLQARKFRLSKLVVWNDDDDSMDEDPRPSTSRGFGLKRRNRERGDDDDSSGVDENDHEYSHPPRRPPKRRRRVLPWI